MKDLQFAIHRVQERLTALDDASNTSWSKIHTRATLIELKEELEAELKKKHA